MKKKTKITGAGFVPVFDNRDSKFTDLDKDILYLVLHDKRGRYDFPKGCINFKHGEQPYDCAVREMHEECNLKIDDFILDKISGNSTETGFLCGEKLLMFFGFVKNIFNVKINPNPEIQKEKGIDYYEHTGFSWVTYEKASELNDKKNKCKLRTFLIPALDEARAWVDKNS